MKLAHPGMFRIIEFAENIANVLVIENQPLLRRATAELLSQVSSGVGEFVLSDDENSKIELGKAAEVITDPLQLDMNERRFQTKINQEAIKACCAELEKETAEFLMSAGRLGAAVTSMLDFSVDYTLPLDVSGLLKLLGLHIDTEGMQLPERLLEYMKLCRNFFGKRLFVFLNLKSFLSEKELVHFYSAVFYEKFDILLLESVQRQKVCGTERISIIDGDLCDI
ncbi:MAG: type II-A CRISPR-associated protein Csn2 [Synergistes jonesii]|uniref:type II-A CRISPR-associated protein Csn2 n=1 Tax=Synergistes jonesii TaxID=2754 RepID=UPI002A747404|nr:type II-A CRISPR-associated protein Csn2 [Synergistes jonesii]MDY2984885.1 type II-A CRISPR-associated protein Csn2 [Synergistes jonesii]